MTRPNDKIHLCAFLMETGHHIAAWRHPDSLLNATLEDYVGMAELAEAAGFDAIFIADSLAASKSETASRQSHNGLRAFEPLTLLSAIAARTRRIGLIATASTSFIDPFNLARQLAALDHLSNGRAAWNIVTSSNQQAAWNFGHAAPIDHADRYARAAEFTEVVFKLWDSWEDGARLADRAAGRWFDPELVHEINHKGPHFTVRGPLNVPRPPQGHPLIFQAGTSGTGQELAAQYADAVFTLQPTLEQARTYYSTIKARLPRYGRTAESLKVMSGVFTLVAPTRAEAEDRYAALQNLIDPVVAREFLSRPLGGIDLSKYELDDPLPADLPVSNVSRGSQDTIVGFARRGNMTLRDLLYHIAGARGHWQLIGSPTEIADALQERFEAHGADGFNILPALLPSGLQDFITLVVPELRRRGLLAEPGTAPQTLRERFGLPRPENVNRA